MGDIKQSPSNKVFFITGISSGFGRSIVENALNRGHYVIGTTRNGTVPYEKHSNLTVLPLSSFSDIHGVKNVIDQAYSIYKRIDVVINNAGYGIDGAVEEYTIEEGKAIFDVNVWGTVAVVQAVLPYMRQQGSGHIINVSSVVGVVVYPGASLYNSSKFAIEAISEALASEAKPFGIDVTILEPGAFKTSFQGNASRTQNKLSVYKHFHDLYDKFDAFRGDVDKLGQAIMYIVDNVKSLPIRVPLGSDSVTGIRQKLTSQLEELKKVETLSVSTDIGSTAAIKV